MKALVKTQKGDGFLEVRDVPLPVIGENEVLIAVRACGVCGTDLHIYHDEFPYWPPVVLGHEFSGTIIEVGHNVSGWARGDRVVGEPHTLACGFCELCRTGNPQLCAQKRSPGWGIDGACASMMRWPDPRLLHRVPRGLPLDLAVLTEPLANVVTDIVLTRAIVPGDLVAVAGPGPIGIMAALVSKYAGARHVVVLGTDVDERARLSLCRTLPGIDTVVNVELEDAVGRINDLTGGRGADVFIEASGSGLTGKPTVNFPYDQFMMKSVRYFFNLSTKYDAWDRALAILSSGQDAYRRLISHTVDLSQWETVFADLESRNGLKAVFTFEDADSRGS
jgi:L-iditol 2-dehydrogenase